MPSADYADLPNGRKFIQPYVSCWIDLDHDAHEMECVGSWTKVYIVPRWQTVSGSQYAHSPATIAALPDGRLIQAMQRVILEAGEKAVDPPMIAVREAVRSDLAVFAGGVTWVDAAYDERLGEVLRPLSQDHRGHTLGLEMLQDLRRQVADAFYLSKITLPPQGGPDMTAYEVGQRIQEFYRNALPLFEPMELDYNGQLCEQSLELMSRADSRIMASAPQSLVGARVQFVFESPLREAADKVKVGQFMEANQILATALQYDPSLRHIVDGRKATRDTLEAVAPAEWFRSDREIDIAMRAEEEAAQAQQMLAAMQQGADVAKTIGEANSEFTSAGEVVQ
jgi:hypothetical protein